MFMWIGEKPLSTSLAVPFFKDVLIPFGILFIFVGMFVVVGAGNAVNMTDGLDGLAIVPVMMALLGLRSMMEERMLTAELDGYAEYLTRVRYRLVPMVW